MEGRTSEIHSIRLPPQLRQAAVIQQRPSHIPRPLSRRKNWYIGERGLRCYEDGQHLQCHDEIVYCHSTPVALVTDTTQLATLRDYGSFSEFRRNTRFYQYH
jgi:hypothetical protein